MRHGVPVRVRIQVRLVAGPGLGYGCCMVHLVRVWLRGSPAEGESSLHRAAATARLVRGRVRVRVRGRGRGRGKVRVGLGLGLGSGSRCSLRVKVRVRVRVGVRVRVRVRVNLE